ncbi:hypothetical protein HPB49_020097 [Dermacentor silvarum]|uniref:Uncharacterized protein n=1 Tax=Dermacentor silvarum TaxID=543639 RepID=A0ACB8CZB5_DERSI|nr:hypothetical protein HPB49_020097 [Dermacentor silvarum]
MNPRAPFSIDPSDQQLKKPLEDYIAKHWSKNEFRKRFNIKSFKWFMENMPFDHPSKYPAIEPPHFAWGEARPVPGEGGGVGGTTLFSLPALRDAQKSFWPWVNWEKSMEEADVDES